MITYLASLTPITVSKRVSKSTKLYFEALSSALKANMFQEVALDSFPELKEFSLANHVGRNFLEIPIIKNSTLLTVFQHIPDCNLHLGRIKSVADLATLYNYFGCGVNLDELQKPTSPLFWYQYKREKLQKTISAYPIENIAAIFIPLQTSKRELITWINENWSEIATKNSSLPKFTLGHIPKNLLIGKEISEMKSKNLTFSQIAELLSNKYPTDKRMQDENHIATIFDRYQKLLIEAVKESILLSYLKNNTK